MTRPPRDAAEALRLPPVTEDQLDRVIHAAGTKPLQAIAVLVSALGWYLARKQSAGIPIGGILAI